MPLLIYLLQKAHPYLKLQLCLVKIYKFVIFFELLLQLCNVLHQLFLGSKILEVESKGSTAGYMPNSAICLDKTVVASKCANEVAGAGIS